MSQATFPEMYERHLVEPLFRPWAEVLLDRVRPAAGERVLDAACGTGIVARLAKQRVGDSGRVVGVDSSPQMFDVARAVAPDVEWQEGDVGALPFGAGETFDVVLCQQGIQFFSDKAKAARELRRVLAPGGRFAASVWRSMNHLPLFRALYEVAERRLGPIDDERYAYGDAKALEALLLDAGFRDVRIDAVSLRLRFDEPLVFLRMNAMAFVGMSPTTASMSGEERAALVGEIAKNSEAVLPRFAEGSGIAYEIASHVATAAH